MQQLEAQAVALEEARLEADGRELEQRGGRLAAELDGRDLAEAEAVAVEAERAVEVANAEAEVGEAAHHVARESTRRARI